MNGNFKLKLKAQEVIYITIAWVVLSISGVLYDYFTIFGVINETGIENYDLKTTIVVNGIAVFVAGILGGGIYVFILKDNFRRYSFASSIVILSSIMLLIIVVVSIMAAFIYSSYMLSQPPYHDEVIKEVKTYAGSSLIWQNTIMWFLFTLATIFVLQVKDRYGRGMLIRSLTGSYHRPVEEKRIFMFLDIKSSTSIAEKLGHEKYFQLLNDFFEDVTEPILYTHGEIYQYVGDEVVVSWPVTTGKRKANCLKCFFLMKRKLESRSTYYQKEFGFTPQFKAGMHFGKVMAGEIGVIKKQIVYTGDVLNTASRIQEACNQYGLELLISKKLLDILKLGKTYESQEIGMIDLRGKNEKVHLMTISQIQ